MGVGLARRTFVDIEHGQIHCRIAGAPSIDGVPPLLMLHGGPGSSAGLVPMIEAIAAQGICVIAPDLMGNGQSDPPPIEPDMAFYADCIRMVLDKLGISQVDCYGHHAGAQIGCELAIRAAGRVRRLILDGVGLFSSDERRAFQKRYAPPIAPDAGGDHLLAIWRFLSATTMRFPHYSGDDRDRIPGGAPQSPPILTDQVADVVRNWRTYHLTYRASFTEDFAVRLPMIEQPTIIFEIVGDPLARHADTARLLLKTARVMKLDRTMRATAIAQFVCADAN